MMEIELAGGGARNETLVTGNKDNSNENEINDHGIIDNEEYDVSEQTTAWVPDTWSDILTRLLMRRRPLYMVIDIEGSEVSVPRRSAKTISLVLLVVVIVVACVSGDILRNTGSNQLDCSYYIVFNESQLRDAVDEYLYASMRRGGAKDLPPIGMWDVSRVTSFRSLFSYDRIRLARYFSDDGIRFWDVSNGTDFSNMFFEVDNFDADLSAWDVSGATSMYGLFSKANSFRGSGLGLWNVSRVEDMSSMFYFASEFDADLSSWDMSSVTKMHSTFSGATSFSGTGVGRWNVSRVVDMTSMFWSDSEFDTDLSSWDTSTVTSMSGMFYAAESFLGTGVGLWNVSRVEYMSTMFEGACEFDADLSSWDTSTATTMSKMFRSATSFEGNGLADWNVSSVYSVDSMFYGASNFSSNLCSWGGHLSTSSQVGGMFEGTSCHNATDPDLYRGTPFCYDCVGQP